MSSERERPRFVIWVPDLASETGWSGVRVYEEEQQRPRRSVQQRIGFKPSPHERSKVE